jgi:hypothetical protein
MEKKLGTVGEAPPVKDGLIAFSVGTKIVGWVVPHPKRKQHFGIIKHRKASS